MLSRVEIYNQPYQVAQRNEHGWELQKVLKSGQLSKIKSYLFSDGKGHYYTFMTKAHSKPQTIDDINVAWLPNSNPEPGS